MHSLPNFIGNTIKINKVITIPPEPLQLPHSTTNEMIDIPVPSSHLGPASVIGMQIVFVSKSSLHLRISFQSNANAFPGHLVFLYEKSNLTKMFFFRQV